MASTVITATAGTTLFGAVAVIGLIILLIAAELADTGIRPEFRLFSKHSSVVVVPLLIASAFIVFMKLLSVFS